MQIRKLITDLARTADALDAAKNRPRADADDLDTRRRNLMVTITSLEDRLACIEKVRSRENGAVPRAHVAPLHGAGFTISAASWKVRSAPPQGPPSPPCRRQQPARNRRQPKPLMQREASSWGAPLGCVTDAEFIPDAPQSFPNATPVGNSAHARFVLHPPGRVGTIRHLYFIANSLDPRATARGVTILPPPAAAGLA